MALQIDMPSIWTEVYGELVIIALFSIGFLIFRLLTQQNWFQPGCKEQKIAKEHREPKLGGTKRKGERSIYAHLQRVRNAIEKKSLEDTLAAIESLGVFSLAFLLFSRSF